jgi:opacity protein-like surface antigen
MSHSALAGPRSFVRLCCLVTLLGITFLLGSVPASAQETSGAGLEFALGWSHETGNFGLDGFHLETGWWFTPRVSVNFSYADMYDNSPITAFALSSLGSIRVKSRMQNFLLGPRIAFPDSWRGHSKAIPFGEALFGGSHLRTTISQSIPGENNASDNAFTWGLGGGIDYAINPNWVARVNVDLLRTHFGDAGQSRLRLVLGGAYTFGSR